MAAKIFEVNDVLPATTQLKISWDSKLSSYLNLGWERIIRLDSDINLIVVGDYMIDGRDVVLRINWEFVYENGWIPPYTDYSGGHNYIVIDTSSMDISNRTIKTITGGLDCFYWEDLNASSGYTITFNSNGGTTISDIEEATELPTPLPTPTKSGYKFVAWYYESNFQTRAKAGDTIESNVTLYAKWHNLGSLFTEIADAIRSKDGTSENIRDVDFGERVKQIQGAIELTQAQYDALGTKDANTYYLIVEVE